MQYRPSPEASLPTPPHSPGYLVPIQPATILLDSLAAFYQQERYWVHHTRAALEHTISKGADARAITYPTPTLSEAFSSSPSSPASAPENPSDDVVAVVKMEPTADADLSARATRWTRRKNMMRLRLDGIISHSRRRRPMRASSSEPGARLLEMFSELVDARMESCMRVSTLIQRTSRPDLHIC